MADALSRLLLLNCVWNSGFNDPTNDYTLLQLLAAVESGAYSAEDDLNTLFGEAIEDLDPDALEIKQEETILLSLEDIFSRVQNSQTGPWGVEANEQAGPGAWVITGTGGRTRCPLCQLSEDTQDQKK